MPDLLTIISRGDHRSLLVSVHRDQSLQVVLRLPDHLHLANVDVLHGIDGLAVLLNVLANTVRDQFGAQLSQVTLAHLKQENCHPNREKAEALLTSF